jgi:hypothetical protein
VKLTNYKYHASLALIGALVSFGCEAPVPDEDSPASIQLGEFDLNGDGLVSAEEWEDTAGGTKPFEDVDVDGDGQIGEAELAVIMEGMADGQIFIPTPLVCEPGVAGVLTTPTENILLSDATAETSSIHLASGCLTSLQFTLSWGDGCKFSAEASVIDDGWQMNSASITGGCDGLEEFSGLEFNEGASTFGLLSGPAADATEEEECVAGSEVNMIGRLVFGLTADSPAITLSGLKLQGDIHSMLWEETTGAAGGSCGTVPETCVDQGCGADAYGVACGECGEGFKCIEDQCAVWNCPPMGPFGTEKGDILTNVTLHDCDGNPRNLHELCGAKVGYINLLAGH